MSGPNDRLIMRDDSNVEKERFYWDPARLAPPPQRSNGAATGPRLVDIAGRALLGQRRLGRASGPRSTRCASSARPGAQVRLVDRLHALQLRPMTRVRLAFTSPPAHPTSGFMLVGVVLFVIVLTILGLSLFSLSSFEAQFLYASNRRADSYYAAASAIERARFVAIADRPLSEVRDNLPPGVLAVAKQGDDFATGGLDQPRELEPGGGAGLGLDPGHGGRRRREDLARAALRSQPSATASTSGCSRSPGPRGSRSPRTTPTPTRGPLGPGPPQRVGANDGAGERWLRRGACIGCRSWVRSTPPISTTTGPRTGQRPPSCPP